MKRKHIQTFLESLSSEEVDNTGMMSDVEVKQEVLDIIKKFRQNTNTWAVRDTLSKFTNWEFWTSDVMAIIDIDMANEIADTLYEYVENLKPGDVRIDEVYEEIYNK